MENELTPRAVSRRGGGRVLRWRSATTGWPPSDGSVAYARVTFAVVCRCVPVVIRAAHRRRRCRPVYDRPIREKINNRITARERFTICCRRDITTRCPFSETFYTIIFIVTHTWLDSAAMWLTALQLLLLSVVSPSPGGYRPVTASNTFIDEETNLSSDCKCSKFFLFFFIFPKFSEVTTKQLFTNGQRAREPWTLLRLSHRVFLLFQATGSLTEGFVFFLSRTFGKIEFWEGQTPQKNIWGLT